MKHTHVEIIFSSPPKSSRGWWWILPMVGLGSHHYHLHKFQMSLFIIGLQWQDWPRQKLSSQKVGPINNHDPLIDWFVAHRNTPLRPSMFEFTITSWLRRSASNTHIAAQNFLSRVHMMMEVVLGLWKGTKAINLR